MTFGGYDMSLAAKGKTKEDIYWVDQSANEAYWAANGQNIAFGKTQLANYNQQLILDNGMSLAMAPKKTFLHLMETLLKEHKVPCQPAKPLWACQVTEEQFASLPSIKFDFIASEKGDTKTFEMPPHAYLKREEQQPEIAWLLLTPWDFAGLGGKKGEEYWVLGAQFL